MKTNQTDLDLTPPALTPPALAPSDLTLSNDQNHVLRRTLDWYSANKQPCDDWQQFLTLGGYAGTGKTTLVGVVRQDLADTCFKGQNEKNYVWYSAYTGKASQQLAGKISFDLFPYDQVSTLHRLIYSPIIDEKTGRVRGWRKSPAYSKNNPPKLIIVDEASMVPLRMWEDLLSLRVPILAVGDHGQLPPIQKRGEPAFNLMADPELRLEKIHRQAEDNPIIRLASLVREGRWGDLAITPWDGQGVCVTNEREIPDELMQTLVENLENSIYLTDKNNKRVLINKHVRKGLDLPADKPVPNDKVICLKNNYTENPPIFNGQIGYVDQIDPCGDHWYDLQVTFDAGTTFSGQVSTHYFNNARGWWDHEKEGINYKSVGNRFDYGYGITVHKAQGCEFDQVVVVGNGSCFKEHTRRWIYTAITRAKTNVAWFRNL